jgi:hypothetical protein
MDSTLIKKIEIERKFATAVYKNFVSLRYGMDPCCIIDAEAATIDKELCDWQDKMKCEATCVETQVESKGFLTSTPYDEPVHTHSSSGASCAPVTYCPDNSVLESILKSIQEINIKLEGADLDEDGFVFTQPTDATEWYIEHNLGKFPNIRLEMLDGTDINGQITYIDENTLKVNFDVAVSGKAFLS